MYQHLILPLDGSPLAEAAIPYALELARKFDSKITLLRVLLPASQLFTELGSAQDVTMMMELHKREQELAQQYLKAKAGSLKQEGYNVSAHLAEGISVADFIVRESDALDADTIVMSTHGRSGVGRFLFGSVAENVLRHAEIPVLLIRSKASDRAG